ncbi:MAG: hypothetical protein ACLUIQ_10995 [Dialister invisus]
MLQLAPAAMMNCGAFSKEPHCHCWCRLFLTTSAYLAAPLLADIFVGYDETLARSPSGVSDSFPPLSS